MFAQCNSCLQSIYKELMKQLGYSVFVDRIIDGYSDYDFSQMKSELLDAIDRHDKPAICKISHQINTIALTLTKQLISEI